MPRRFDAADREDRIIYDEEDIVKEMYLVTEGAIGVGYNMLGPASSGKDGGRTSEQIALKLKRPKNQSIVVGDHYVLNKRRCQFLYVALKEVTALALRKNFLHKEVLPKYPEIAESMQRSARDRYQLEIHDPVVSSLLLTSHQWTSL